MSVRHQLKLVGRAGRARGESFRRDVARENRAAAHQPLDPMDPRWVLAARAYAQLEGSTLTPERRDRVLRTARALGMRMFDANLIIAIVQDQARRGGDLSTASSSLTLVSGPPTRSTRAAALRWIAALGCAAVGALLLIRWLV